WSNGGEFFDHQAGKYRFAEPPGLEAFEFMMSLPMEMNVATVGGAITDERAAMQFSAPWWANLIRVVLGPDRIQDFGSVPLPRGGESPATLQYSFGFFVNSQTEHAVES